MLIRLLAFVALVAIAASCRSDDLAITYLRSDSYTFSGADRVLINRVATSALREVRMLLPGLPERSH